MPSSSALAVFALATDLSGAAAAARSPAGALDLVTFDGEAHTTFVFKELNDPVMGGQSTGTWHVNTSTQTGVIDGNVVNVPSLKAPGFIKAAADGTFLDASKFLGGNLVLSVRTTTPDYTGFRVSFAAGTLSPSYSCAGGGGIPFSRGCYKAKFHVPPSNDYVQIRIPLTNFSDKWSSATGEQTTTCAEDKDVCPTADKLKAIKRVELWGEGALGRLHLDVKRIYVEAADGAATLLHAAPGAVPSRPPAKFDACRSAVQPHLRYGVSALNGSYLTAPVAVDPAESLATAICCDKRTTPYAEPRFLFESPMVALFENLGRDGPTTFYDSACGLPLFRAPLNRSFAEFKADTEEHGWPSFRPAELIAGNVLPPDQDGFVFSKCGTHLGSFLPDAKGARWCLDVVCLAGSPPPN